MKLKPIYFTKPLQAFPHSLTLSLSSPSSSSSQFLLHKLRLHSQETMANPSSITEYMPVGFRFRPTDEELVGHYMKHKLMGDNFLVQVIPEIDLCKHEPWDLPAFSVIQSDDPEWFFFSPLDLKYSNSTRSNRATECGFWKATGKDREIKVRGTDNVIGRKKTLVFYRGRVPNGVKTNWVIHEYHAVTFPVNQRTFVLCRLMKKPEKKEQERTDVGEPRSDVDNSYMNDENSDLISVVPSLPAETLGSVFPMPPQANECDLPLPSYVGNVNSGASVSFETTEEEEEFVNSLLVDDDDVLLLSVETRHAFVNDSTPSESLKMVYYESSDTDTEVVSARYGNIPDILSVSKNAGSSEYGRRTMIKSSHGGAEQFSTSQLSSNQEASREIKGISFQDDIWGVDTSSGDSTPVRAHIVKACRAQFQPRSANSVSHRAGARRSQPLRKVSTKAASRHEAQRDNLKESNDNQRNTSEAPSNGSSDVSGKSSFIHLETPALSQNLRPPSVYLANLVIGFVLFIVIVWEILSCGRFY